MGWPPELDSCRHGNAVGYCDTCIREREVSRRVSEKRAKRKKKPTSLILRVFYATHSGATLSGCSVIVAKDRRSARRYLKRHLRVSSHIKREEIYDLSELDINTPGLQEIDSGDY